MVLSPFQKSDVLYDSEFLAEYVDGEHYGPATEVRNVMSINRAEPGDLTFSAYDDVTYVKKTDASVVVCSESTPDVAGQTLIKVSNPRIAFWKIVDELFIPEVEETIVHPQAVIEDRAEIGDGCVIGPNVYVGQNVRVGDGCKIQAGTSIGGEGFGFVREGTGEYSKQIHKGQVLIEDNVEIGSNCSIDRAFFGETVIGEGTKMDNLIHIAHRVTVGENVWMAYGVGISGTVTIGDNVRLHPQACIAMHTMVGEGAEIAMNAAVLDDVEPHMTVAGTPASPVN